MSIPEAAALSALTLRHRAYTLLARLFLAPPEAVLLTRLAQLPPFDALLSSTLIDDALVESCAVHYQTLFGFTLFPYESIFLGRDLLVNGDAAAMLRSQMERFGFQPAQQGSEPPDHAGMQLAYMAYLIALERDALHRHNQSRAEIARDAQSALLHEHLARWLPVALLTMRRVASHLLYSLVADLTLELILVDLRQNPSRKSVQEIIELTVKPPVQEEEDDGLTAVIRPLLLPVESGLFLTRAEMREIARELHLPVPAGERVIMLKQLFEAAGQFDAVPPLLMALQTLWLRRRAELISLLEDAPCWKAQGQVWLSRMGWGLHLLNALESQWRQRVE